VAIAAALMLAGCGGGADDAASGAGPGAASRDGVETTAAVDAAASAPTDGSAPATDVGADAVVVDGVVNQAALSATVDELLRLDADAGRERLGGLAASFERELWTLSGLEAALGGAAAADAAFAEYAAELGGRAADLQAAAASVPEPAVSPAAEVGADTTVAPAPAMARGASVLTADSPGIGEGMFGGYMISAVATKVVLERTNTLQDGERAEAPDPSRDPNGSLRLEGTLDEVGTEARYDDTTSSSAVTTKFRVKTVVKPCPGPDGRFTITATIAVSASAGGVGQNGTFDLTIDGQAGDDAELVSADASYRMQWADFSGTAGQFVDIGGSVRTHGDGGSSSARVNRTSSKATPAFTNSAVVLGILWAALIAGQLVDATKEAWQSGRCVRLETAAAPGPKGLDPGSSSTINANPRSRIDGSPTGGTVTATLSAGGAGVTPSSAPADATFIYGAPGEPDQSGTVSLEAKSRRGIAKASIDFDTARPAAYIVKGGLEDWQVNQTVCDVMKPFELSTGIGTMKLSGGLTGTYTFAGVFNAQYTGTYTITLPDGPGKPGTMVGGGGGSIAGRAGSGTERYTLTPTTC
jgi:hypothetical protein